MVTKISAHFVIALGFWTNNSGLFSIIINADGKKSWISSSEMTDDVCGNAPYESF